MMRLHQTAGALAFALAVALAPAAHAQSKEPIKIAIGVDAAFVPLYLSKQNKLFEKHGVNVELVQFTQGGDALDAVAAGQMPLGGAAEPTTLIRATRTDKVRRSRARNGRHSAGARTGDERARANRVGGGGGGHWQVEALS